MNKKNLAIVFGITSNLTFAMANVILGLKKYSSDLADDIIIYHDKICQKDQEILKSILPCKFIKYEFPIKDVSGFNEAYFKRFSELAYSRYECFSLLNEYQNVMWLDVDILLQRDISSLLSYAENGFGILAPLSKESKLRGQLFNAINDYDMNGKAYSSGTFIIRDNLKNYENMADWCYKKTLQYSEHLLLPDQAILNFLIQEFDIDVKQIELDKYCFHPRNKGYKEAYILHTYSCQKFWNFYSIKEWNKNYKDWVKMGGSPTKIKKADPLSLMVNKKWPEAPSPVRKPRHFVKFLYKTLKNQ